MPIRSLLSQTSFNPDQTEMIAKAFDDAWAQLQGDEADPAMASLVRTALAKRIIETAQRPGIDVQNADSDDPGQGFQLKAATIPIEGGQYWPVGTFMGSLVRRQDRIVWLRSFACCLLST
jgi:hypothetical protein